MYEKLKLGINKGLRVLYKNRAYLILILLGVFLLFVGYEYYAQYFEELKNPKHIKKIILSYGKYSVFVFIGMQILQVIAFFIPGEVMQIAGGYIYGAFLGGIITLVGITIGSSAVYLLSNYYGKPLIRKIISEKHLNFFDRLLKLGSINYVVFLLFLIPGIPKDVLGYICGISDIKFKDYVLYSTLGRIPGIFVSAYFGARMYKGNKGLLITIAIVMTIIFFIGVLKGEKIVKGLVKKNDDIK